MCTIKQIEAQEKICDGRGGHLRRVRGYNGNQEHVLRAMAKDDAYYKMQQMIKANIAERQASGLPT